MFYKHLLFCFQRYDPVALCIVPDHNILVVCVHDCVIRLSCRNVQDGSLHHKTAVGIKQDAKSSNYICRHIEYGKNVEKNPPSSVLICNLIILLQTVLFLVD